MFNFTAKMCLKSYAGSYLMSTAENIIVLYIIIILTNLTESRFQIWNISLNKLHQNLYYILNELDLQLNNKETFINLVIFKV